MFFTVKKNTVRVGEFREFVSSNGYFNWVWLLSSCLLGTFYANLLWCAGCGTIYWAAQWLLGFMEKDCKTKAYWPSCFDLCKNKGQLLHVWAPRHVRQSFLTEIIWKSINDFFVTWDSTRHLVPVWINYSLPSCSHGWLKNLTSTYWKKKNLWS